MPNPRRERTITVSGLRGYFPILPEEQKAFRIELFFSATNVGRTNYYSYEWYKERTLYGRFKIARGEYTTRERLLQYQNELIYAEEASLFEIIKRLQCQAQKQYDVNRYVSQSLAELMSRGGSPVPYSSSSTAFDQIPPQPISIPGLQVDGIYYNMFPGCAGKITVQTWYDDDLCKDVNGNPLTKDNRGKPPDPASVGRPPSGTDLDVPAPDYAPGGTYQDPNPNADVPTDTIADPNQPFGQPCKNYKVHWIYYIESSGAIQGDAYPTVPGKVGAMERKPSANGIGVDIGFRYGIGCLEPGRTERFFLIVGNEGNTGVDKRAARFDFIQEVP